MEKESPMESTLKMVGASLSNPSSPNQMTTLSAPMTSGTITLGVGELLSADNTLKSYVEEMIITDNRFKGMSRYIFDINFYWTTAIPTACAGHGFIFFNPTWWDKMVHEERKTVIAHEIWHLISNHLERGRDKDPESYNIAGDYVINLTCHDEGFISTLNNQGKPNTNFGGAGMLIDERFRGKGTDAIYAIVHADRKKNPSSHGSSGAPSVDQIEELVQQALEGTGKDLQQQAEEHEQDRQKAVEAGMGAGTNQDILRTEGLKIFIQKATYEEIFEEYLTDPLTGGKRTYMRPSRRQTKDGLRLKGKYPKRGRKNRLTHLVYALDVSGSITAHQKKQFLASAKTLKEKLNPQLMTVILWDDGIRFEKTFREDEVLDNIHVMTGGGTDLRPVYKRVQQLMPEALVIFTDLAVNIPPKPDWETIWFVPSMGIGDYYLKAVTYGDIYLIPEK
jgi:hypothetical protein